MKTLEQYINETEQIDEGLFSFLKNIFKASGKAISQNVHTAFDKKYPNFTKAFDELQQADAEDKELIQKFNTMYETVDKMKDLSDDEKVFYKLNLTMAETGRFEDGEQGEGVTKLDNDKHKGYLADLQKKLQDIEKNHKEIYNKYQEAAKKGEVKKEDVLGKNDNNSEPAQSEETVNTATDNAKDAIETAGGNPDTVTAAVKKFLGLQTESKIELPNILGIEGYITEGDKSEQAKKYFSADEDKDGKRLQALTTLLGAWQGLAKQLNVPCENLTPLIQAILANEEIRKELNKK